MNVLIEGIDRAGKGTLVKELKNRLHYDTRFLGHRQVLSQYQRYLHEYSRLEETIIERGHISEAVYSQVFNRKSPFSKEENWVLNEVLNVGCIVIFCQPSLENALNRYAEKTLKQTISTKEIEKGMTLFEKWFKENHYQNYFYYQSKDYKELENLINEIEKKIK